MSAAVSRLLGVHAEEFQALSSTAAAFHDQFVGTLRTDAAQYISAELANVQQTSTDLVNTSTRTLLGSVGLGVPSAEAETPPEYPNIFPSQSLGSLGPFEAFIRTDRYGGDIGIRLNTPFGSPTLFAEGTSLVAGPDGSQWGTYHIGNPLLYVGFTTSMYGPTTQWGLLIDGLTFTFPGPALLGGYFPDVSYRPVYF